MHAVIVVRHPRRWGEKMIAITERPYAIDFTHSNGLVGKIDFMWGLATSLSPVGITIWRMRGQTGIKVGEEFGLWPTFGAARERALVLAESCFANSPAQDVAEGHLVEHRSASG